ncbi:MAG: type II toxin-antitoxin system VapC family toxin [Bacteroidales bacterium]|nr:type II toxin-antitoxin system VapC family toxin [Bacteroidales bacterium]
MYWYIEGDAKLSIAAQSVIQDASNEVFISPASYWEIAIKVSVGKWTLNRPYEEFINLGLNQYGFQVLPILPTHTVRLTNMTYHHRDPFDRLLIAQALSENIPIVSADSQFDAYGVQRLW